MVAPIVKWATYNNWSGPYIKGSQPYRPPKKPTEWDVIAYAVGYPEGGCYDSYFAADGTAVTFGLFQWTATSSRLQTLLFRCLDQASDVYLKTVGELFDDLGLELSLNLTSDQGELRKNGKVLDKTALRAIFTPPNGKCPKTGPEWKTACEIAKAFWALGQDLEIQRIQQEFFQDELYLESLVKRPKLKGKTIASILYPTTDLGNDDALPPTAYTPARALFWSFWQNAPRVAEQYLNAIPGSFKNDPKAFTLKLARKFAHSTFGNWGIEKAAENKREARYTKIVKCVNQLIGKDTLPLTP
jgi:hypothetical protein